jgi:hypothetical protein
MVMMNGSKGGCTEDMLWFTGIGFVNCEVANPRVMRLWLSEASSHQEVFFLVVVVTLLLTHLLIRLPGFVRAPRNGEELYSIGIWDLESKGYKNTIPKPYRHSVAGSSQVSHVPM